MIMPMIAYSLITRVASSVSAASKPANLVAPKRFQGPDPTLHSIPDIEEFFNMVAPEMDISKFFLNSFGQTILHVSRAAGTAAESKTTSSPRVPVSGDETAKPIFYLDDKSDKGPDLFDAASKRQSGIEYAVNGIMRPLPRNASASEIVLNGGAVVVHTVDTDPGLGKVRKLARNAFRMHVSANLYVGGPGSVALRPHTDRWDTVILQVQGQKMWTLCIPLPDLKASEATRAEAAEALRNQVEGCSQYGGPAWDENRGIPGMECRQVLTHAGDFLYMPKGIIHAAKEASGSGVSAHLTIGLDRSNLQFSDLEMAVMDAALATKGDGVDEPGSRMSVLIGLLKHAAKEAGSGVQGIVWRDLVPVWALDSLRTAL